VVGQDPAVRVQDDARALTGAGLAAHLDGDDARLDRGGDRGPVGGGLRATGHGRRHLLLRGGRAAGRRGGEDRGGLLVVVTDQSRGHQTGHHGGGGPDTA